LLSRAGVRAARGGLPVKSADLIADNTGMTIMPSQFSLIGKLLDAAATRQRVISQNVSNVNTPGYRRQEVRFEEELSRRLQDRPDVSLDDLAITVEETRGLPERADGNTVDIDAEMGQQTRNAVLYQTYSQLLATKLAMMRSAISGRS
jgi:flagellar basal-body rod protein FlgB